MIEKIEGIVLNVIRHSDRHNIVTLFTRERGRLSFLSPSGSGRNARLRNARLQPLAVIETDVKIVQGKELLTLGRFSVRHVWKGLYFHPAKQALTLFLQEFLDRLMRFSAPDSVVYQYVVRGIEKIDGATPDHTPNLHIAFLTGLLSPMGIAPNLDDFQSGDWFDMRGGEFLPDRPLHNDRIHPSEASFIPLLSRMTMRNAGRFRFSSADRRLILQWLLRYYSIHFPGLTNLHSLDILTEIYHS